MPLIQKIGHKLTLEFTHNNRRHADRQNTPFELMFGESLVVVSLSFESTKYLTIEDNMKTLLQNQQEALAAHELARSRMTDQRRLTFTPFKKGDRVWLDSRNLKTIYHKKMKPKREGPFVITEVLGLVTSTLPSPTHSERIQPNSERNGRNPTKFRPHSEWKNKKNPNSDF